MELVLLILKLVSWVVIADALLSWVQPSPHQMPRRLTAQLTEPLYRPFRAIFDPGKTGGFDLSPLLVLILIQVVSAVVRRVAIGV